MRASAALLLLLAIVLGLSTAGCAWANRENRPLWNAFEEHVVPESDVAFYLTLPFTIPGGLVAILLDTFIVHPALVADDAGHDAGHIWDDMDWRRKYYTQLASLPLRSIATPIVFLGSFLARSLFDVPTHRCESGQSDESEPDAGRDLASVGARS